MLELFKFVESNKGIDFVIVSELSRFGRTNEVLWLVEKLDSLKICLISLKENLKTLDENPSIQAQSKLILNIWTGLNNFELESIRYRVKSGRDNAVLNKGSWGGSNKWPYGYKTIDSKLVINESEAETVKLMFEKNLQGWGSVKIANYFNSQGIPTRTQLNGGSKKWERSTIFQMLRNKIYVGQRKWQKEFFSVPELRVISDHDFNLAQKQLTDKQTSSAEFSLQQKYSYLFDKGLIRCGKCGKTYYGVQRSKLYRCASGKTSGGCGNPSVKIDFLETEVQKLLIDEYINLVLLGIETSTNTKNLKISLDMQKQELKKHLQKADRIKELYTEGSYSKIEYQIKKDLNTDMISKTELNIESLENQIQSAGIDKELSKISQYIANGYTNNTPVSIPKDILRKIITLIVISEHSINVSLIRGFEFSIPR